MDIGEQLLHSGAHAFPFSLELLSRVADDDLAFTSFDVAHTEFKTNGCALHLPLVELVARVMNVAIVDSHAKACLTQLSSDFMCFVGQKRLIIRLLLNRDDDELMLGDLGWQDETLVIRMDHDHGTN